MQRVHFQVRVGVFNCQQILAKISFVIFDNVIKEKTNRMWFSVALMKFHWSGINWHVFNQSECRNFCLYIIIQKIAPQAKSGKYFQIWFFPWFGGKKWRRSEHAHASYPGLFFRPNGFSPYMGREERRVQRLDYFFPCEHGEEKKRKCVSTNPLARVTLSPCKRALIRSIDGHALFLFENGRCNFREKSYPSKFCPKENLKPTVFVKILAFRFRCTRKWIQAFTWYQANFPNWQDGSIWAPLVG